MDLYVGEELQLVGLKSTDYLLLKGCGMPHLAEGLCAERLHLFVGEICFCKDRLDFNQAGVESLVILPEMNIYV